MTAPPPATLRFLRNGSFPCRNTITTQSRFRVPPHREARHGADTRKIAKFVKILRGWSCSTAANQHGLHVATGRRASSLALLPSPLPQIAQPGIHVMRVSRAASPIRRAKALSSGSEAAALCQMWAVAAPARHARHAVPCVMQVGHTREIAMLLTS